MQEFDPGKQVDGAEVGKAVTNIISQLGDKGQLQKQSSSGVTKLVPTGPGLASLSKKLVDRIVSGQYIHFSELPPAKGRTRSLPNAQLPPGSGRQCKQGLGKSGPKHIYTMFHQCGNQHRGLVQVLPVSGPQLRNVPDESISEYQWRVCIH